MKEDVYAKPYPGSFKSNFSHSFLVSTTMLFSFRNKDVTTHQNSTNISQWCQQFLQWKIALSYCLWSAAHISILDTLLKRNQNAIQVTSRIQTILLCICFCYWTEMVFPAIPNISRGREVSCKKITMHVVLQNNNWWFPIHIATFNDTSINILFLMVKKNPMSIIPENKHINNKTD